MNVRGPLTSHGMQVLNRGLQVVAPEILFNCKPETHTWRSNTLLFEGLFIPYLEAPYIVALLN